MVGRGRSTIAAWRSPYFDWSAENISPQDAASLDTVARLGRVITGLAQWRTAFDLLVQRKSTDGNTSDGEDAFSSHLPVREGPGVKAVREKFNAFVSRITPPPHGSLRDYAAFIENLIGDDPALATRYASPEDDTSLTSGDPSPRKPCHCRT